MTTYKYDKIIKSVETKMQLQGHFYGLGNEEMVIVVTWLEKKHRSRKVKPVMGDDYHVSETYEVETQQTFPYSDAVYKDFTSKIGQPRIVRHLPDSDGV